MVTALHAAEDSETAVSIRAGARRSPAPEVPAHVIGLLVLAWAALITMTQLDRLIGAVVGENRSVYQLTDAIGFTPWAAGSAWETWASDETGQALDFIVMHTAADCVFIACYGILLFAIIQPLTAHARRRTQIFYASLIWAMVSFDLAENTIIFCLTSPEISNGAVEVLAVMQAIATGAKWIATIVLIAFAVLGDLVGVTVRRFLRGAAAGLYAQRLGLIVVAGFIYLALSSAGDLAEQIPDVYRGWLDLLHPEDGLQHGAQHALLAAVAGTIVFGGLVYFGRQRGRRYQMGEAPELPRALLLPWVAVAVLFLIAALFVPAIEPWTFWIFIGTLVFVPAISALIRRRFARINKLSPLLTADVDRYAPAAFLAGDGLSVAWLAAGLLAPFAAMVPVLALASRGASASTPLEGLPLVVGASLGTLGLAVVVPAGVWHALRTRLASYKSADAQPVPSDGSRSWSKVLDQAMQRAQPEAEKPAVLWALEGAFGLASLLTVLCFVARPLDAGAFVGPLGTVVLLLGAWTCIAGVLILWLGERRPPEIFTLLRLRSTPVVMLTIILPIVVASLTPVSAPHAMRMSEELRMPPHRPPISNAFAHWSRTACVFTDDGTAIQPLILVGAEGGGIRAATWTVDVLRELFKTDHECAAKAVFASSGASGGSVGLAMLATSTEQSKHEVTVTRASGPDALGATVAGLLSSELITAVTGLRPAVTVGPTSSARDRAALHELVWESDPAHQLGLRFDAVSRDGTGLVIFNSTDSVSNCKVVISQLDLSSSTAGPGGSECAGPEATLAHAVDLIDVLGDECRAGMTWATASFLSARFPFVSPSGRLGDGLPEKCRAPWDMQLLDGGLLDNSGLGTISDLLPELLTAIRARNGHASAGSPTMPVVVPIVLWVSNGPGSDVLAASGRARPEWVAPVITLMSVKGAQLAPAAWLSRLTDQLDAAAICGTTARVCVNSVKALHEIVPTGIAVASQATEPATSVPLGWTLSWFSRSRLGDAAKEQATCTSAESGPACRASGDYSPLGALLEVFSSFKRVEVPVR